MWGSTTLNLLPWFQGRWCRNWNCGRYRYAKASWLSRSAPMLPLYSFRHFPHNLANIWPTSVHPQPAEYSWLWGPPALTPLSLLKDHYTNQHLPDDIRLSWFGGDLPDYPLPPVCWGSQITTTLSMFAPTNFWGLFYTLSPTWWCKIHCDKPIFDWYCFAAILPKSCDYCASWRVYSYPSQGTTLLTNVYQVTWLMLDLAVLRRPRLTPGTQQFRDCHAPRYVGF